MRSNNDARIGSSVENVPTRLIVSTLTKGEVELDVEDEYSNVHQHVRPHLLKISNDKDLPKSFGKYHKWKIKSLSVKMKLADTKIYFD